MDNSPHRLSNASMLVLGFGAVAGGLMGAYLYTHPKLRKNMRKADTVREAAGLLTHEMRKDGVETAQTVASTVSNGVTGGLRRTRQALGRRFMRNKKNTPARIGLRHVKNEAKHVKNTAKNEATHAAGAMKNEMERIADEMGEAKDFAAYKATSSQAA